MSEAPRHAIVGRLYSRVLHSPLRSFYGLGRSEVVFFCQGTMPCFTPEGKIMMQNAFTVAEAPDGNGGIYRGLHLSGSLDDMQRRGVKYVHAFAVDNVIGKVADPTWYGYCIDRNADMGCKVRAR